MSKHQQKKAPLTAPEDCLKEFQIEVLPTCPAILIKDENKLFTLPMKQMNVQVEINFSTVFVHITGVWRRKGNNLEEAACMFVLPGRGIVTKFQVKRGEKSLSSMVVPNYASFCNGKNAMGNEEQTKKGGVIGDSTEHVEYIPDLFRAPISGVAAGEDIEVQVWYVESLEQKRGKYRLLIPLQFPKSAVIGGDVENALKITVMVNAVNKPDLKFGCGSGHELHPSKRLEDDVAVFEVSRMSRTFEGGAEFSVDFSFVYAFDSESVHASCIFAPHSNAPGDYQALDSPESNKGNFVIMVSPPATLQARYARRLVFLLDRSGSMTGRPYSDATRALKAAIENLGSSDSFTVCAFDHTQEFFSRQLIVPSEASLRQIMAWAAALAPKGGATDIQAPLTQAIDILKEDAASRHAISHVVLITDGCVSSERDMVRLTHLLVQTMPLRIFTVAIGSYANWMFLKMLARVGRGLCEVVSKKDTIFNQICDFMDRLQQPVLTDIEINMGNMTVLDQFPELPPDLSMGYAVVVSGEFDGEMASSISVSGKDANGQIVELTVTPKASTTVPVHKMLLSQKLDSLAALLWLEEEPEEMMARLVDLSCQWSVPTPYTSLVVYQEKARMSKSQSSLLGDEMQSDVDDVKCKTEIKTPIWKDKKKMVAIGVVTGAVIGTLAFSFGNMAATVGNASGFDSVDIGGGDGCCDCDCDGCEVGDCLAC